MTELLILAAVLILLFGASQLPKLARAIGSSRAEYEKGVRESAQAEEERRQSTER
jgi:sec-independent protein translocase protein TatA